MSRIRLAGHVAGIEEKFTQIFGGDTETKKF